MVKVGTCHTRREAIAKGLQPHEVPGTSTTCAGLVIITEKTDTYVAVAQKRHTDSDMKDGRRVLRLVDRSYTWESDANCGVC